MNRFVIDASVVLTWCFPDEHSEFAEKVSIMFEHGASAIAPSFWPHEVLNALLVGEKRKRITAKLVEEFLADLSALPIELRSSASADVFDATRSLSREYILTSYDAAYLHLAQVTGLPLATLDDDLIRACRRCGVDLF